MLDPVKPHAAVVAVSAVLGVLFSGILALVGASLAGHDSSAAWPFPDLTGMFYFVLAAIFCPVFTFGVVKFLKALSPNSYNNVITALILPPLIAFPLGILVQQKKARDQAEDSLRTARFMEYQKALTIRLREKLIKDPEIMFREKWYEPRSERYFMIHHSLKDPTITYAPAVLEKIYQMVPDCREAVLENPACDSLFLERHWRDAFNEARQGAENLLLTIVSSPKASRELLTRIDEAADSNSWRGGGALTAILDFRLRGENLVLSPDHALLVDLPDGDVRIHASRWCHRAYQWKNVTRNSTLEPTTRETTNPPDQFFRGNADRSYEAGVTRRGEFREGLKNFGTVEEAVEWIEGQSLEIPTVFRNDGLLVSCAENMELNLLRTEVWQILIDGNKPMSLPGASDGAITLEAPRRGD